MGYVSKILVVVAMSSVFAGCASSPEYQNSTELGFKIVGTKPAKHWRCQKLSVRGDLVAYMLGSSITLYRKKEGVFIHGIMNKQGMTPSQVQASFENPEACAGWNLANWQVIDREFYVFNHPYFIEAFDNAESDPQAFFAKVPYGPPYFTPEHRMDGEYTVSRSSRKAISPHFYAVADQLSSLTAAALISQIDFVRQVMSPDAVAARRAKTIADNRTAATNRAAVAEAARQAFVSASARTKQVGTTVCSADNRVAYVEQIAGDRVKLAVRGRAVAREEQFGALGPFKVGFRSSLGTVHDEQPVEDPHFLFNRLPGPIRLTTETAVLWDESQFWGECDYR